MFDLDGPVLGSDLDASQTVNSLLSAIAVWALSPEQIEALFKDASAQERKKMRVQMNRDVVRIVLLVLGQKAFATGTAQIFSLRQLAKAIDAPRLESMQRSLRNWLLPMLAKARLIDGFVLTETWSTEPHEIAITPEGLEFMRGYFRSLARVNAQISGIATQGMTV